MTIYFPEGNWHSKEEKDEFYDKLAQIRHEGTCVNNYYSGDYMVCVYELDGKDVEYWFNSELGIPHSIVFKDCLQSNI